MIHAARAHGDSNRYCRWSASAGRRDAEAAAEARSSARAVLRGTAESSVPLLPGQAGGDPAGEREGDHALLAVHPPAGGEQESSDWLEHCAAVAEKAFSTGSVILSPVDGDPKAHAVVVPLRLAGGERIVTAVLLKPADKNAAEATRQLLELMAGVVAMTEVHLARQGQRCRVSRSCTGPWRTSRGSIARTGSRAWRWPSATRWPPSGDASGSAWAFSRAATSRSRR